MTWLQILAQAGVIASILGLAVALSAYFNGKHIKENISSVLKSINNVLERIDNVLERMDKGFKEMDKGFKEMSKEMDKGFKELLKEIHESFKKMDELSEKRHREVLLLLKKGFGISEVNRKRNRNSL